MVDLDLDELGAACAPGSLDATGTAAALFQDAALAKGTSIGRYRVLERLGAGAMGVVYAAYDPELDRKIAIKLLRPDYARGDLARRQERLIREARAIAKVSHPNVVGVFDVGVHDGRVFLAMEYLGGGTLRDWASAQKRSWREIVEMFIDVGHGLAAAHAEGLVHRDFKPDNALLDKQGKPKVVDFGLVRLTGAALDTPAAGSSDDAAAAAEALASISGAVTSPMALTRTGAMTGTPAYMAPEQFLGRPIDARTDQFAFGVALYEVLYGERPFEGETVMVLAGSVTKGRMRPTPKGADVPAWVRACVVRALRVDPAERHPGFDELLAALASDPIARRRVRPAASSLPGWTTNVGTWGVVTDGGTKVYRQSDDVGDGRAWSTSWPWTDQVITVRVKPTAWNGSDRLVAVVGRLQNATNYYFATMRSSNRIEIKKLVDGGSTVLASKSFAVPLDAWRAVRFEIVGTNLRLYIDGVLQLSATDSTYASGSAGLATFYATANFDDFAVRPPRGAS